MAKCSFTWWCNHCSEGATELHSKVCILHELGHHLIHANCIGYRIADKIIVTKTEREAETFASLVIYSSLSSYIAEQAFLRASGLPEKTAKLHFLEKKGL